MFIGNIKTTTLKNMVKKMCAWSKFYKFQSMLNISNKNFIVNKHANILNIIRATLAHDSIVPMEAEANNYHDDIINIQNKVKALTDWELLRSRISDYVFIAIHISHGKSRWIVEWNNGTNVIIE